MKRFIKLGIIVLGFGLLSFTGIQVISKIQYKSEVEDTLQTIPQFSFETVEGVPFTNNDLKESLTTIFIYFNSECGFCEQEAKSIQENIEHFKNTQLIFVSFEPVYKIGTFSRQHKLDTYDNVTFLFDKRDDFATRFDATSVPYLLIYDKDQKLIKKHKGQLSITGLLKAIN